VTGSSSSLRVGIVCPYSFDVPGGVQNHVLGLARYLRHAGHRAWVLAPGRPGSASEGVAVEDFASVGAAVPVRYNGSVARVNFGPLSAARVRRWLRRGNFDVLHIHEPITPSISLLALWAADQSVVATFHAATPRSRSMQLAGGVLRGAIEKIDAGIAVSESARNVVVQHLGRDAVVIPNGIQFDDFAHRWDTRAELQARLSTGGTGRPRLIFLGRLDEPRKGLDVLLAAVPLIMKTRPDLEVIVAGQGTRALPKWCRNLGMISVEAKIALLGSADVFVAPHLARESFGIVLLEAMASGIPIVASELSSFLDVLGPPHDERRLGEVFTAGDPRALARAVLQVLDRPNPRRTARAQYAARRYDWSAVGETVVAVYRATLSAAPTRRVRSQWVDRANVRAERTWAALDAALVRRAQRALELVLQPGIDPTTAVLVAGAANAALEPHLARHARERAESDLSHILDAVGPMLRDHSSRLDSERARASICRRLHNDAVATALSLRRRYTVRILQLAGRAAEPRPFEMAEGAGPRELGWLCDR
jgi:phosphatidyl-myo-inositol alpha-mannosyltransferase